MRTSPPNSRTKSNSGLRFAKNKTCLFLKETRPHQVEPVDVHVDVGAVGPERGGVVHSHGAVKIGVEEGDPGFITF